MVFLTHISVALLLLLFLSSMFSACDTTSSQDTSAPSPVTTKTQPTATPRITQGIPAKVSLGDELAAFIAVYGHPKFQYGIYDFGTVQGTVYSEGLAVNTISDSDLHVSSISFVISKLVDTNICTAYNPADSKFVNVDILDVKTYRSRSLKKELPASAWVGTGNGELNGNQTGPLPDNPPGEFVVGGFTNQGKTMCNISL